MSERDDRPKDMDEEQPNPDTRMEEGGSPGAVGALDGAAAAGSVGAVGGAESDGAIPSEAPDPSIGPD